MKSDTTTTSKLLRLVGVMAMGVGAAWTMQVLGLGGSSSYATAMWELSAATVAGGGAGLIVSSSALRTFDAGIS
jgi:hypothetical protein